MDGNDLAVTGIYDRGLEKLKNKITDVTTKSVVDKIALTGLFVGILLIVTRKRG